MIGACKLHDGSRYVILVVRRQSTHRLQCFIEEFCHHHNIRSEWVRVENRSRETLARGLLANLGSHTVTHCCTGSDVTSDLIRSASERVTGL